MAGCTFGVAAVKRRTDRRTCCCRCHTQTPGAANEEGNTPLHWACLNGHAAAASLLLAAGASASHLNGAQRTPVDEAQAAIGVARAHGRASHPWLITGYLGTSDTFDLKVSRSIYRDAVRKLGAYGRLWTRSSKNFIDDTEIEVQRRRAAGWEAGLAHREFVGRAVLDAALSYRRGVGGLGSLPAPEEIFDEGTSRMKIVNADVQWMQPLQFGKKQLRYLGGVRAQWNQTRLVPQDRFTIGGRYSVRGFDGENLLTAERGLTLRNELAWQWHPKAEAYWAVDYGRVAGPSAAFLAGTNLSGTVVGVRGALQGPGQQQWSYDVFVGGPLSQPDGFGKRSTVAGFQLSWLY